jgi:hypothetical protein
VSLVSKQTNKQKTDRAVKREEQSAVIAEKRPASACNTSRVFDSRLGPDLAPKCGALQTTQVASPWCLIYSASVSLSLGELEARCTVLPLDLASSLSPCGSVAVEHEEPDKE